MKTNSMLIISFALIGLLLMSLPTSWATDNPVCKPTIVLVNQDPYPVVAGDYVKVLFEVSGLDNSDCNGFSLKIDPAYPFSLDPGVNDTKTLNGYIATSADYKSVWDVPFKLRVADNAAQGEYYINVMSRRSTDPSFDTYATVNQFNVTLSDVQTSFDVVVQDRSSSQVSIGLANTGKNTANAVVISVPQQQNFRTGGISQQIVGNLAAGDYTTISFNVISNFQRMFNQTMNQTARPYSNSTSGQPRPTFNISNTQDRTSLTVQVSYTDGIGKRRTENKTVILEDTSNQTSSALTNGFRTTTTTAKSTSFTIAPWMYVVGVGVIAIGIYFVFRKRIHHHMTGKKSSEPDWVTEERAHKK